MSRLYPLIRKPRHRWFAAEHKDEERWDGPYKTIEEAAFACLASSENNPGIVYVAQGHKMTKGEIEEFGVDYSWEVDTPNAIEVSIKDCGYNPTSKNWLA